jgi:hypothetical protein
MPSTTGVTSTSHHSYASYTIVLERYAREGHSMPSFLGITLIKQERTDLVSKIRSNFIVQALAKLMPLETSSSHPSPNTPLKRTSTNFPQFFAFALRYSNLWVEITSSSSSHHSS